MVMGNDSCFRVCGFESWQHILDCKNCIICLKRPKINKKEAGVGTFKKIELEPLTTFV